MNRSFLMMTISNKTDSFVPVLDSLLSDRCGSKSKQRKSGKMERVL